MKLKEENQSKRWTRKKGQSRNGLKEKGAADLKTDIQHQYTLVRGFEKN